VSSRRIFRPLLAPLMALALVGSAFAVTVAASAEASAAETQASQPMAPDTMAARVQGCTACHGVHGEGTDNDYFPRLAGKPADYLYNQLQNFREGRRKYPPMNYLVTYLSDDYLHQIATYFSQQRPPYPQPAKPTASTSTVARGQQIVLNGDASKNIPACAACHGTGLTGMEPAIPGLVGLHADYISAQLGAWRSGSRHAKAPDCMQQIATRLTDDDVSAVAAWLSTQTAPANPVPAPAGSRKMPLACGSEPQ
jgi:cytochrome c553